MTEEKYRVLDVEYDGSKGPKGYTHATYKETHEGTMVSFDGSVFTPGGFTLGNILDWLERGGGDKHGYTWEVR